MIASSIRRLLWCRISRSRSDGTRSCSRSSDRIVSGTVFTANSQTLGPFITNVFSRFSITSGLIGQARAAAGHLDVLAAAAVAAQVEVEAAIARRRVCVQQHRARAVAEEHAGAPVLPVQDLRERVGADDEHVLVARPVGQHHPLRDVQREHEAGAHRVHVERRALPAGDAELLLDQARDRRLRLIGRRARHDDQIDRRLVDAGAARGSAAPPRSPCRWAPPRAPRSGARGCRSCSMIHSSDVSTCMANSWLVTVFAGT